MAEELGVKFRYGVDITGLLTAGDEITGVSAAPNWSRPMPTWWRWAYSTALLRPGQDPGLPAQGLLDHRADRERRAAPVSTMLDETYKIAVTRFDDRIRVGGMAEIAGFDTRLNPRRRETLEMVVNDLFPGAGDTAEASFWTGLRPMTPDGTPVVGRTGLRNLFINTGHGTLGWTMSCGSAQLLADLISARRPPSGRRPVGGRYSKTAAAASRNWPTPDLPARGARLRRHERFPAARWGALYFVQ
jgi:D-amino-acid dehydrogenase